MPLMRCRLDDKPGYKWGEEGKCYTYEPGNEKSRAKAKLKAIKQGFVIAKRSGERFEL